MDEQQIDVSRRGFLATAAIGASAVSLAARASTAHADPRSVLRVSTLDPDPADATSTLQEALDSDADTVIIDHVPDAYRSGPLFIRRSNVHVILEPGVTIRSLGSASFPDRQDTLLTVRDQSNVTLSGYGAQLVMNGYGSGEHRHALRLLSVHDTVIEGVTLRGGGGDGLYLGNGHSGPYPRNANVTVRDVTCLQSRRNGMSVITVDGLTVEGCAFLDTQGTNPQAGADVEPNGSGERLNDVVFRDCYFKGNRSAGFVVRTNNLNADSRPFSIAMQRSTIGRQIGGQPNLMFINQEADGQLTVEDCLVDVGPGTGGIGLFRKKADAARMTTTRTTIWDVGNALYYYGPISVLSGSIAAGQYPSYGGADFNDCVVVSDLATPAFVAYDGGSGATLTDIHGSLTVANRSSDGPHVDFGPSPTDVDLVAVNEQFGVRTPVQVTASRRSISGGGSVDFTFRRAGDDLSAPLAIAFETTGTARERYDYGGLGKVAVIKPGERETRVPVRTFARRQDSDPARRSLVLSLKAGHRYAPVSSRTSIVAIID